LIESFKNVVDKLSDIELKIIGEGPELAHLKRLSDSLGLNGRVDFLGKVENNKLESFYLSSDIVVFPSMHAEPLGRVALEAGVCGKPIIASNSGGIPEIVENKVSGILINPGNVKELTEALLELSKNREMRIGMGREGKRIMKEKFNKEIILDNTIDFYNKILKE
jgi:glycosyltransferase involved in cell wall biosynthesis